MRLRSLVVAVIVAVAAAWGLTAAVDAQTRGRAARGGAAAGAADRQVHGNLAEVMRGILFPQSNVVFTVQSVDPASIKPADDPSTAADPLLSTYGGWQAVANSGIALAESANLLTIPGRVCSNGRPAPIQNADWIKFVAGLREAGMFTYKVGMAKNRDGILDASDKVSTACSNCHEVYREKTPEQGGLKARCTK
jgi:hypothetical protein